MSKQALEKFNQVVLNKPVLQEKLRNSPDLKAFTEMVVKLGQQEGCVFTAQEVAERLAAAGPSKPGGRELSDKELELAAGGGLSFGSSYWCGICSGQTSAEPPSMQTK